MYRIKIDTTKRFEKSVILEKDSKQVDIIEGDIDITSSIAKILDKNNLNINDIEEVIPNEGPGSFTGIKIGIAIANTINLTKATKHTYKPKYGAEPNIQK